MEMSDIELVLNPIDWAGIGAISSVGMFVLNILLLVSVIIGYRSISEGVKTRDSGLLVWAIEHMSEIKPDIRTLHQAGKFCNGEVGRPNFEIRWSAEEMDAANRVSIVLQRLGYMANSGLISKKHFSEMWGPVVVKAWAACEQFVYFKRLSNDEPILLDEGGYSRKDFEKYARYCAGEEA